MIAALSSLPADAQAGANRKAGRVCMDATRSATSVTSGGKTTWNWQGSFQTVCFGFGSDTRFDVGAGVACTLVAAAAGEKVSRSAGLFTSGLCSGADLATNGPAADVECGMLSDLLGAAPSPFIKAFAAGAGVACAFGRPLGGWIESESEAAAARGVMQKHWCLRLIRHHFPLGWIYDTTPCQAGDNQLSLASAGSGGGIVHSPSAGGPPEPGGLPTPVAQGSATASDASGSLVLQLHAFPVGSAYYFCHVGDGYPTGGSVVRHGRINVVGANQVFRGLCSGPGNAWIGLQAADGHDYYTNQVTLRAPESPGLPAPTTPFSFTGSVSAANRDGQMAVQVTGFPTGITYYFCHAGSGPDYPTGGTITAKGQVTISSPNQSWSSGLCSGGHNTNMWIGLQATDGHDYYSNQVIIDRAATPGASLTAANSNGQMAVQVTGFPTGITYYFCHAGSGPDYPTGGTITAKGQVTITSPNQSWSSGLCSGGHNTNMWIGLQATDGHDYYSNQAVIDVAATPGASASVFGSNGQMSLQVSSFPQGTNYYFCHEGAPSEYPYGGAIIGRGQLNITGSNGTYGPLCAGSGNAWIGVQGADGHDYYTNQIVL
jgi:hypothetical protein